MFLRKLKVSITKLILPFLFKLFQFLKSTSRVTNFFEEKRILQNNFYDFRPVINELLKSKKLIGLDVGAQGGFNSDVFFQTKYNKYFETIVVDPLMNDEKNKIHDHVINKGLWSTKGLKKLNILSKRPGSSSMFEPNKDALKIYGFKEKDYHLFEIDKAEMVECDTLSSSLKSLKINNLDYLKIDTQGSELEILKGLGDYRPLLIKCEVQIFPMYKNSPYWTEVNNHIYQLNYILCDWKKIGSHATRTPAEMDMMFIPNFLTSAGKKLIKDNEKEFISLLLICGQIKLLKQISEIIDLKYTEYYKKIEDRYFN